MITSSKEPKNIPVSISFLHDLEYKNLCLVYNLLKNTDGKRRAFSERKLEKEDSETKTFKKNKY
jgi:hypothetical protein